MVLKDKKDCKSAFVFLCEALIPKLDVSEELFELGHL